VQKNDNVCINIEMVFS